MKLIQCMPHCVQLVLVITFLVCPHFSVCDQDQQHVSEVIIPSISFDNLEDFARNASQYFQSQSNTSMQVVLLQGNHTLASELTVKDIGEFSLISNDTQTVIKCESGAALVFDNIGEATIEGLTFIGCTGNMFRSVKKVTIQYSAFISLNEDGSMIAFKNSANITESSLTVCTMQTRNCSTNTSDYLLTIKDSSVSLHVTTITSESNGAILVFDSSINITDSLFCNSIATIQDTNVSTPALIKIRKTKVVMTNTTITNNKWRVIVSARHSNISIAKSRFCDNTGVQRIIVSARYGNINITKSYFCNNTGVLYFGTTHTLFSDTNVTNNTGRLSVIYIFNSFFNVSSVTFTNNSGSFLIRHSNVKFNRTNVFAKNVVEHKDLNAQYFQAESAITSISSTVTFHGTTVLTENHSQKSGGALHDSGSLIKVFGKLKILNNTAGKHGGGAYFFLTELVCYGNCTISGNNATEGGGIHAVSSMISSRHHVHEGSALTNTTITFANNNATQGGGLYFKMNSRINGLDGGDNNYHYVISFVNNIATKNGGGIFIDDETYSGTCESVSYTNYRTQTECFLQTYENDHNKHNGNTVPLQRHLSFTNNTAGEKGSILYGGLLDRCTLNLVADVNRHHGRHPIDGLSYFMNESGIVNKEDIASDAVRICFCQTNDNVSDCTYQPHPIHAAKAEKFTISIVVVDQVDNPIATTVTASLSAADTLAEGEQSQKSLTTCTNLTYAVSSRNNQSNLSLYADQGPCLNKGLSKRTVEIHFKKCTCPIGFQTSDEDLTKCKCVCHEKLQQYMSECKNGILKRKTNCWINYDNVKGQYVIYPRCPYDYCKSPLNSSIDLRHPNGADGQCADGRFGFLCGACRHGFSLSMGTTHCIKCPTYWQAVLFTNILAGAFGGIIIVIVIFGLNMTVASGTINGLIFYANIVFALDRTFLPFNKPNFFTVFIAILNSELRLERCLYDGMDAYAKAWLSLLPPLYLIALVLIIMGAGKYSSKCAYLMGKRNPVAILATLILLSYTSIIQIIIDVFLSITMKYSDGSREKFWRADPRIKYFQGKHIPLFLITLLITIIGLAYTFLLFSWQWLVRAPDTRMFRWTRNTKLNSFMDAYLAPYKQKYRFWTGFLLFSRIAVNFMIAINEGGREQYDLLVVGIVMAIILIAKSSLGDQLYKMSALDYFECFFYFNLLIFTLASYYSLNNTVHQEIVAKVSVSVTLIMFLAILFYHSHLILSNTKWYGRLKQKFTSPGIKSKSYGFSFSRHSVRCKTTKTEVGLSDAITESTSEGEQASTSDTSNSVRKIGDNFLNGLRHNRFQMSTRSYNSLYLRESLLN